MDIVPESCFACSDGVLIKPYPIHSYHYVEEGYVPRNCNCCGLYSDQRHIYRKICKLQNIKKGFSIRNLRKILKILCDKGDYFAYSDRDILLEDVKNDEEFMMRELDEYNLADLIFKKAEENNLCLDLDRIIHCIYVHINTTSLKH